MADGNELTGNWDKAIKVINTFGKELEGVTRLAVRQGAEMVQSALLKHIDSQDLGWEALDRTYQKYKVGKGLSGMTWLATSNLYQSFTTTILRNGDEAFVGVLRNAKAVNGQKPVLIAAVHEYGSPKRGIPARPLFRPTFKEMVPKIQANIIRLIERKLVELTK